jgi:hypothetical protein
MEQIGSWTWADVAVMLVFGVAGAFLLAIGTYVVRGALTQRGELDLEIADEHEPERAQRPGPGRSASAGGWPAGQGSR